MGDAKTMKQAATIVVLIAMLGVSIVAIPAARGAFPGDNGDIVFSRTVRNKTDIWVIDRNTGEDHRLTRTKRPREIQPDWNAAGNQVAYSRCGRGEFSNCDIWVMNADGSEKTQLTSTPVPVQETWPAWSPDGTMITYTSNAEDVFQDVWVMNADGTNQTRLTMNKAFDAFPEWSPDGSKIAFTSDRDAVDDIWVMDPDGSDPVRLTSGNRIDERPDWSPDSARIAFSRGGNIWTIDAEGTNPTKLTDTMRHEFAPAFSPNGRSITFNRVSKDGRISIWTMRTDGSRRRQLTEGRLDFFPDWQPL
jgi:Tol biopolymer transport system component